MNRLLLPRVVVLALLLGCIVSAQQQKADSKSKEKETPGQKIDPLALKVLKAATDRIHNAKAYSFHALVSHENLGTNGQVITQFNKSEFIVQQPDKLRINVRRAERDVQLLYDAGQTTLFTPDTHLYTSFQASATINSALDGLQKRDIFLPASNFLQSDPYQSLTKALVEAYVIGRVEIAGETVHQLAFTEPHAEWQLWVTGGPEPTIRKMEVVNKEVSYHPRTIVDFSDWNFNASPDPAVFTFKKPADATQIGSLQGLKR